MRKPVRVCAATTLVPGQGEGSSFVLREPLSFWGGLDVISGRIIDRWHPQHGDVISNQNSRYDGGAGLQFRKFSVGGGNPSRHRTGRNCSAQARPYRHCRCDGCARALRHRLSCRARGGRRLVRDHDRATNSLFRPMMPGVKLPSHRRCRSERPTSGSETCRIHGTL